MPVATLSGSAACAIVAGLSTEYVPATGADEAGASEAAPIADVAPSDAGAPDIEAQAPDPPRSCREILARDPTLIDQSGYKDIYPGDAQVHVFCEMHVDDGGWTLVGRSSVPVLAFGWTTTTGDIAKTGPAYSLDVVALDLAFHEVMVATRDSFEYVPADRAYKFTVPADFATAYADAAFATSNIVTLIGDCVPEGGPAVLAYAGLTSATDGFFLRQTTATDVHTGLHANAFVFDYSDCSGAGLLAGRQGLIFVR